VGLLNDLLSYIDSRKRVAASNISDAYNNPAQAFQGLLSPPPEVKAERARRHREKGTGRRAGVWSQEGACSAVASCRE
jgi:hypothetical protein